LRPDRWGGEEKQEWKQEPDPLRDNPSYRLHMIRSIIRKEADGKGLAPWASKPGDASPLSFAAGRLRESAVMSGK
jgi:hypothetical protein